MPSRPVFALVACVLAACTPQRDPVEDVDPDPTCEDGAQNGGESDVDCGGACAKCDAGRACGSPGDCASDTCTDGACVAAETCAPETDEGFCGRLGSACDALTAVDNCGNERSVASCGTCAAGTSCVEHRCSQACTPESNTDFCRRLGKACGRVTGTDNCGAARSVTNCGVCEAGLSCVSNACASTCTAESNTDFCRRLGKACGRVTGTDNCGAARSVTNCGVCEGGLSCVSNACVATCEAETDDELCDLAGAACGAITATDDCGTTRTVASCGTCGAGTRCDAITANQCGATCARGATRPCSAECFCEEHQLDANVDLHAVWAASATDAWAVGTSGSLVHWDGATWTTHPRVSANALYAIWGWRSDDVWAAGSGGTLLHFDGTRWAATPSGTTKTLRALWGGSSTNVWAVGFDETVLRWNGTVWQAVTTGFAGDYEGIASMNSSVYVVGYDGATPLALKWNGTMWTKTTLPSDTGTLADVTFNGQGLTAVGLNGTVVEWNGGTWSKIAFPAYQGNGYGKSLQRVVASGGKWILGDTVVLRAGSNGWTSTHDALVSTSGWKGIHQVSGATFLVGAGGRAAVWDGTRYTLHSAGYLQGFESVWGAATDDVWIAGTDGTERSALWRWNGTRLESRRITSTYEVKWLYDVWGTGAADVWAVGAGYGIFRFDGTTWNTVENKSYQTYAGAYFAVHGTAPDDVWVTAMAKVRHFDGVTWTDESVPVGQYDVVSDIWAASRTSVWAVADGGQILRRGSSSASWIEVPSGTADDLHAVWGSGPGDVWFGGSAGYLARWNGSTLVRQAIGTTKAVTTITGRGPNDVLIAGPGLSLHWNGSTFRSVEAGLTASSAVNGAWVAPSSADAWVVGSSGLARRKGP